jgi:hypothetical protein
MVAPEVEFDVDPQYVKISWNALSAETDGGLPLLQYQIQI